MSGKSKTIRDWNADQLSWNAQTLATKRLTAFARGCLTSRKVRIPLGVLFIAGGLLWFLPVLGVELLPELGELAIKLVGGHGSVLVSAKRYQEQRRARRAASTSPQPGSLGLSAQVFSRSLQSSSMKMTTWSTSLEIGDTPK
jgi:hypothetical protein